MSDRFLTAFIASMGIPVILAFACNVAFAETTVRVDYGIVEAIEIFRTADSQPVTAERCSAGWRAELSATR